MKKHALDFVNRDNEAINCYNKILSINPNHLPAIVYKCSVEKKLLMINFLINALKAISIKPVDYLDYLSRGLAYYNLKIIKML